MGPPEKNASPPLRGVARCRYFRNMLPDIPIAVSQPAGHFFRKVTQDRAQSVELRDIGIESRFRADAFRAAVGRHRAVFAILVSSPMHPLFGESMGVVKVHHTPLSHHRRRRGLRPARARRAASTAPAPRTSSQRRRGPVPAAVGDTPMKCASAACYQRQGTAQKTQESRER